MTHAAAVDHDQPQRELLIPIRPVFKYLSCAPRQTPDWRTRFQQLLAGKAYFPSPTDFNDPFDCLPHIETPKSLEELEASKAVFIERVRNARPDISAEDILEAVDITLRTKSIQAIHDSVRSSAGGTASRMGVFCVAECIDSVLMWSHYASNHTGIAVGFELLAQQRGGLMPMFKVFYRNERPTLNFFERLEAQAFVDGLTTKARFWDYEQEWRSIKPDGARTIVTFDPIVITGVVFGAKCEAESREWVKNQVAGTQIRLFAAIPDASTFELDIVKI